MNSSISANREQSLGAIIQLIHQYCYSLEISKQVLTLAFRLVAIMIKKPTAKLQTNRREFLKKTVQGATFLIVPRHVLGGPA